MCIGGHDNLPAVPKGDFVLRAEFVRQAVALHAQPCLQGILWIVNPGVVHAAVARAGRHPQLRKLLDKKNILPPLRNSLSDSAPNHAAADDQYVGLVHNSILTVRVIREY
jgi:hypothetical protein